VLPRKVPLQRTRWYGRSPVLHLGMTIRAQKHALLCLSTERFEGEGDPLRVEFESLIRRLDVMKMQCAYCSGTRRCDTLRPPLARGSSSPSAVSSRQRPSDIACSDSTRGRPSRTLSRRGGRTSRESRQARRPWPLWPGWTARAPADYQSLGRTWSASAGPSPCCDRQTRPISAIEAPARTSGSSSSLRSAPRARCRSRSVLRKHGPRIESSSALGTEQYEHTFVSTTAGGYPARSPVSSSTRSLAWSNSRLTSARCWASALTSPSCCPRA
jgi:hypothetical protein